MPKSFYLSSLSMFHMTSTIIKDSSQTREANPEKLTERKGLRGEEHIEMVITRCIFKAVSLEATMGLNSWI